MLKKQKVVLSARGVKKYHTFSGVNKDLRNLISSMRNVIVYFDPDVDGCISGLLVCKHLSKLGINFEWYINSNRSHDWTLDIEKIRGRDIIAVDFLISRDKIEELCNAGCNIVSMDHHNCGSEFIEYSVNGKRGVVINNQYPFEEDDGKYLSGAGVVFESLVAIDPSFDTLANRVLVGITLLSDIRDIENPLAENYLYDLYSHKYEGYIKYLIMSTIGERDYGFGLPKMDRNYVDFKFSPAVNACLRFNRQDEVVNFFLGKGKLNLEYRDKQQDLVHEVMGSMKTVDFPHLRVCYFNEEDFMDKDYMEVLSSFVGLIASRCLDDGHSAICYMIAKGLSGKPYVKRASFRGKVNGLDYQSALSKLFLCVGHKPAFGIKGMKPSKALFEKASELCGYVEANSDYKRSIIDVNNLSLFVNGSAYQVAEDNLYKLSQNKVMIRYTGSAIENKRSGANYKEYSVNGIPVLSFNLKKDFSNGLIMPMLERGLLTFYLE